MKFSRAGKGKKRRGEHTYLKITKSLLAELFDVSVYTIDHWIWKRKLNPKDILDIIDKYTHREKLDRRRKDSSSYTKGITHEEQLQSVGEVCSGKEVGS